MITRVAKLRDHYRELAGARSYAAIAEWAQDAPPGLRARLGLPGSVPDLATFWRVLTAVHPAGLDPGAGRVGCFPPGIAPPGRHTACAGGGRQDSAGRPGR
jgi:hypothetical protein